MDAIISLVSGAGVTGAASVVIWVWKLATIFAKFADSVEHINNTLADHETRIRTVEQK